MAMKTARAGERKGKLGKSATGERRRHGRGARVAKNVSSLDDKRPADSLAEYDRKRDFKKTPAPGGRAATARKASRLIFVVQEHHASRLHYDFRLESDGVLKSWALPKEPSMDPKVRRLAVHVEDHPLPYAKFHGDIPAGQYGAGHVEIWDHGTFQPADRAKSITPAVDAGKVEFELSGTRLQGGFVLVRAFGRGGKDNWLLIKRNDRQAKAGSTSEDGAVTMPSARRAANTSTRGRSAKASASGKPERVEWTHTDKVMYPLPGYTKGDVLRYYEQVADLLLPHLRGRPVTLERLPDGVTPNGPRFWQKNAPAFYPAWIPRVDLPTEEGKPVNYVLVNDVETLLYLVNQGTLTFHPFLSRVQDLNRPDFVLFDLDPGESTFADAAKVARELHRTLESDNHPAFLKTSGKTGLHVLVPWRESGGYDAARAWAMVIADRVTHALPDVATTERLKSARRGRVYVDVIQNARGHHVVPPYVLRATPEATVSTPLEWKELAPRLDPKKFDLEAAMKRFRKRGDLLEALA